MPDAAHLVLFFALGAVLGALGGLFGIGGGVIAIPILVVMFHLDQQHAQGTALVMVAPNVMIGIWNYARRGNFDRRVAFTLASCAVLFTLVGAIYATRYAGPGLRIGFAVFLAALAIYYAWRTLAPQPPAREKPLAWGWTAVVGAIGGTLSGLFSVGGASFAVPALTLFFGYSQFAAQGLGLALVAPGTVVGLVTYALAGDVDWAIGIPLALGGTFSVQYGVALARRLPERELRLLFCALLAVSAAGLFSPV
jgi:uncharacterized protein